MHREVEVTLEHRVLYKVIQDLQELKGQLVLKVLKVLLKGLQEYKVLRDPKVLRGLRQEHLPKVPKVQLVLKGQLVPKVLRVRLKEQRVQLVLKVHKELLVLQV